MDWVNRFLTFHPKQLRPWTKAIGFLRLNLAFTSVLIKKVAYTTLIYPKPECTWPTFCIWSFHSQFQQIEKNIRQQPDGPVGIGTTQVVLSTCGMSYSGKVCKGAKIRSRYNQVPNPTKDTNGKLLKPGGISFTRFILELSLLIKTST